MPLTSTRRNYKVYTTIVLDLSNYNIRPIQLKYKVYTIRQQYKAYTIREQYKAYTTTI